MSTDGLGRRAANATKWALATQIISKLITPLTTLILAHLLTPEVFGVVALVAMVTSLADVFSDAGFQKYLIQHEYESRSQYRLSCDVAFWTNLALSVLLWALIYLTREPIAGLLGNESIELAIVVACGSLPLTAAISVQTAVYQRDFDFKTLFFSRVVSALLVLFISVPLAFLGVGYWSIIVGTIVSNLTLAVWLTIRSWWRPQFRFSLRELVAMLSFSTWTLVEQVLIWLTNWVGTFILASVMSAYYVGLYNTTVSLVNAAVAIVSGAVNPVVFATLSRFQGDRDHFNESFYRMQRYLGFAVIPLATFLFTFSHAIVRVYLGSAWVEASLFFGLYSMASAFVVVFGHIASDAYRSLGKPRYSILAQLGFLLFYIPGLVLGARWGFGVFSYAVPCFRVLGSLITHFVICAFLVGLSPRKMLSNVKYIYIAAFAVSAPTVLAIRLLELGIPVQLLLLALDLVAYLACCLFIRDLRSTLVELCNLFGFERALSRISTAIPGCGELFSRGVSE